MDFGLQVRGDFASVRSAADWAESHGLAAIALPDHYLQRGGREKPGWDHLVHLAALAPLTTDIELVSLVSPVTFRHPAVYLKMATTLDEVSGGRFALGLGTGWMDEEFEAFGLSFPDISTRYELTEEALVYIRRAISGGRHGFDGEHYQLARFDPMPRPGNLKLIVGGSGKSKTPRLAGLYADEFNIYACPPAQYKAKAETALRWASRAERSEGDLTFSAAGPAIAGRDESDYRRILESVADLTGQPPEHIEETYAENGFPHGYGNQPSEMLARLEEAGCTRYYMQIFSLGVEDYEIVYDAYNPSGVSKPAG